MSERTPCINPRCKRTAPAEEFPGEMICRKCFRTLPEAVRNEHRRYWHDIRKWDRSVSRSYDNFKTARMLAIRDRIARQLSLHWDREIKPHFLSPEKPEGLDAFLEEVGL